MNGKQSRHINVSQLVAALTVLGEWYTLGRISRDFLAFSIHPAGHMVLCARLYTVNMRVEFCGVA
jgi:hypothetical protein